MKLDFNTIFQVDELNETVTNIVAVRISGVTVYKNLTVPKGSVFPGGLDMFLLRGRPLEVETEKNIFVVTGIY